MPGTGAGLTVPGTLRPPNPKKLLLSVWPEATVPVVVRSLRQADLSISAPATASCSMSRQAVAPGLLVVAAPVEVDAAVPLAAAMTAVATTTAAAAAAVSDLGGVLMV